MRIKKKNLKLNSQTRESKIAHDIYEQKRKHKTKVKNVKFADQRKKIAHDIFEQVYNIKPR